MLNLIRNNRFDFGRYAAVVVGTGFFGVTVAERISSKLKLPVLMLEKRLQVGGNARSEVDEKTGIQFHLYGPHIFHTSNERVWEYVKRFTDFNGYRHHVWTEVGGQLFSLPISLATMSQFWGKRLSPNDARRKITETQVKISSPKNFEEKALATVGRELYEAFFEGYTAKQWQTDPRDLPASVFGRLPVRFNLNTRYFDDIYEGIPSDGYSAWIENMLRSELIEIAVATDWLDLREEIPEEMPVIYTGPVDDFFDHQFGSLGWRTLDFEFEVIPTFDHQGAAQVNFPELKYPYTRVVEYKHFHPERIRGTSDLTLVSREFPRRSENGDEPYYPVNAISDRQKLHSYREKMKDFANVHFGGRLGSYQYLDMHMAIASALVSFESEIRPHIERYKRLK